MGKHAISIKVNGKSHELLVESNELLLNVLRDKLFLTGSKYGCGIAECGACTVLANGKSVLSCLVPVLTLDGHSVTTIEGLGLDDAVVQAFANQCEPGYGTAMQCGFCTPGFVMSAKGLLNENPHPTEDEIRHALSGNLCRCGTYPAVMRAVMHAAASVEGAADAMANEGGGSR